MRCKLTSCTSSNGAVVDVVATVEASVTGPVVDVLSLEALETPEAGDSGLPPFRPNLGNPYESYSMYGIGPPPFPPPPPPKRE